MTLIGIMLIAVTSVLAVKTHLTYKKRGDYLNWFSLEAAFIVSSWVFSQLSGIFWIFVGIILVTFAHSIIMMGSIS